MSPDPPVPHASVVSSATRPDTVSVNVAAPPSATRPSEATEMVAVPVSEIVVVAAAALNPTVPFDVLAPVRVTTSVSPRSSTSSAVVSIVIAAPASPAGIVSEPSGAV